MASRKLAVLLLLVCLSLFISCSSRVKLPEAALGVWYEDKREETLRGVPGQFESFSGKKNVLRFEQQGESAVVYGAEVDEIGGDPERWSDPYTINQLNENSWSFEKNQRQILFTLKDNNHLSVKGLIIRQQVGSFKKDANGVLQPSEIQAIPVESIFVRKS
jgi:hypothetical protein